MTSKVYDLKTWNFQLSNQRSVNVFYILANFLISFCDMADGRQKLKKA